MSIYGNCLCGKPLTKSEQTLFGDRCNDCVTEINIDVHDEMEVDTWSHTQR